ncbi:MAG: ankyrin repeat protein 17-like isoform [Herminiimonas sp.]|nr:ankyrin repeat protein 17-like isoform [Herminiimonas sp.]
MKPLSGTRTSSCTTYYSNEHFPDMPGQQAIETARDKPELKSKSVKRNQKAWADSGIPLSTTRPGLNSRGKSNQLPLAGEKADTVAVLGGDIPDATESDRQTFFTAASKGDLQKANEILQRAKLNNHDLNEGLILSAREGHGELVRVLVSNGADVNFHMDNGKSAFTEALCGGHVATVRTLVELRAKTSIALNRLASANQPWWSDCHWYTSDEAIRDLLVARSIDNAPEAGPFCIDGFDQPTKLVKLVNDLSSLSHNFFSHDENVIRPIDNEHIYKLFKPVNRRHVPSVAVERYNISALNLDALFKLEHAYQSVVQWRRTQLEGPVSWYTVGTLHGEPVLSPETVPSVDPASSNQDLLYFTSTLDGLSNSDAFNRTYDIGGLSKECVRRLAKVTKSQTLALKKLGRDVEKILCIAYFENDGIFADCLKSMALDFKVDISGLKKTIAESAGCPEPIVDLIVTTLEKVIAEVRQSRIAISIPANMTLEKHLEFVYQFRDQEIEKLFAKRLKENLGSPAYINSLHDMTLNRTDSELFHAFINRQHDILLQYCDAKLAAAAPVFTPPSENRIVMGIGY